MIISFIYCILPAFNLFLLQLTTNLSSNSKDWLPLNPLLPTTVALVDLRLQNPRMTTNSVLQLSVHPNYLPTSFTMTLTWRWLLSLFSLLCHLFPGLPRSMLPAIFPSKSIDCSSFCWYGYEYMTAFWIELLIWVQEIPYFGVAKFYLWHKHNLILKLLQVPVSILLNGISSSWVHRVMYLVCWSFHCPNTLHRLSHILSIQSSSGCKFWCPFSWVVFLPVECIQWRTWFSYDTTT